MSLVVGFLVPGIRNIVVSSRQLETRLLLSSTEEEEEEDEEEETTLLMDLISFVVSII